MTDPEAVRDRAYRWQRRYALAAVLGAVIGTIVLLIMV